MVPTAREFISESSYDSSLIYGLTRYRKEGRAHHEFVIIHTVDKENHDQWFRFDGAANTSGPSRFAVASSKNVGASDQVSVRYFAPGCTTDLLLLRDCNFLRKAEVVP